MRQYQVPQFITVEDRIIGPLTIKQSLYLGAGALLIVGARYFLKPFLFWPIAVIVAAVFGALAFLKINEQPFPIILKNALFYLLRPRLFVWKKETPLKATRDQGPGTRGKKTPEVLIKNIPKMSQSKLSDLSWSLDIKERLGRE